MIFIYQKKDGKRKLWSPTQHSKHLRDMIAFTSDGVWKIKPDRSGHEEIAYLLYKLSNMNIPNMSKVKLQALATIILAPNNVESTELFTRSMVIPYGVYYESVYNYIKHLNHFGRDGFLLPYNVEPECKSKAVIDAKISSINEDIVNAGVYDLVTALRTTYNYRAFFPKLKDSGMFISYTLPIEFKNLTFFTFKFNDKVISLTKQK